MARGSYRPRWSPDGKMLIFAASADRGPDVYTVAAEAKSKPNRIVVSAGGPNWSGDGKRIYFQQRGQIWKSAVNGGSPEPVTRDRGSASRSNRRTASTSSTGRAAVSGGRQSPAAGRKS